MLLQMIDGLLTRESAEYKAALEIELWKEIKQQEFLVSLQKKENNLLNECSSIFKSEYSKQESDIRSSKKAYEQTVKHYKEKLISLEKREKKLVQNSKAAKQTIENFEHERCLKLDDIKQKANFRSDFLSLELETVSQKIDNGKLISKKLSKRLEDLERTIMMKEEEISSITSKMASPSFSAHDHDVLLSAKIELSNMKEHLSKLSVSKEKYKLKLQSILDEISTLKQIPITRKPKYIANEKPMHEVPKKLSKSENRPSFENLKTEVNNIIASMSSDKTQERCKLTISNMESDIAKLISERNTLLNTGVYLSDDHIIQQIDKKIKSLLNVKEKSTQ